MADNQSSQTPPEGAGGNGDPGNQGFQGAPSPNTQAAANGAQNEVAQLQDRLLRTQAELDNFRKRSRRELDEQQRYASMPLMRDLVPVVDNVVRAVEAGEKKADAASLLEGFKMVAQQLHNVLERHHCTPIKALQEPFDPHLHEAIMQQPSDKYAANTVVGVAQVGFQLHDRVVRPAQVIVSAGPGAAEQSDGSAVQAGTDTGGGKKAGQVV